MLLYQLIISYPLQITTANRACRTLYLVRRLHLTPYGLSQPFPMRWGHPPIKTGHITIIIQIKIKDWKKKNQKWKSDKIKAESVKLPAFKEGIERSALKIKSKTKKHLKQTENIKSCKKNIKSYLKIFI